MPSLLETAKLDIRNGAIHYKIYQQDGSMQPMTCRDTTSNRVFISWLQSHDRYTPTEKDINDEQRAPIC